MFKPTNMQPFYLTYAITYTVSHNYLMHDMYGNSHTCAKCVLFIEDWGLADKRY